MLVVLVAVAVLATASGVALLRVARHQAKLNVTMVVSGVPRPVTVAKPATVKTALKAAGIVPRPGRLLSLVTHKVLDPAAKPVTFLVNGQPAPEASVITAGATVSLIEPADVNEEAIAGQGQVPAPPEPEVIKGLWHPGRPGLAISSRGAVSGEVITQTEVQPPVPPVPVTEKLVALTFDDGPWPTTPEVLRILKDKNVRATFCVITRQLVGSRLDFAKAELAGGHHLCNHSVDHDLKLPSKPQKVIDDEIIGANRQLDERLALKPTYFRPPGGVLGPAVVATAKAQGQQVLLWTVDTKDYTKPPPEAIVGAVMGQVQPGGVILMHDGGGDRAATIAALPIIIDQLRAAGYEIVLPDEIAPVAAAPLRPTSPTA